jgi:hypothetical protein
MCKHTRIGQRDSSPHYICTCVWEAIANVVIHVRGQAYAGTETYMCELTRSTCTRQNPACVYSYAQDSAHGQVHTCKHKSPRSKASSCGHAMHTNVAAALSLGTLHEPNLIHDAFGRCTTHDTHRRRPRIRKVRCRSIAKLSLDPCGRRQGYVRCAACLRGLLFPTFKFQSRACALHLASQSRQNHKQEKEGTGKVQECRANACAQAYKGSAPLCCVQSAQEVRQLSHEHHAYKSLCGDASGGRCCLRQCRQAEGRRHRRLDGPRRL